jgi:hypothetical protein
MRARLKESWRTFKAGRPGSRFQERFARRHQYTGGRYNPNKILHIGVGIVLIFVGLFLLAVPGPGSLVLVAALGLLGSEFLFLARILDGGELGVRKGLRWSVSYWTRLSPPKKILLLLVVMTALIAGTYAAIAWLWKRN